MIRKFIVKGLVQGIGYRPWVAKIADELNIDGWVRNTGGIVTVLAIGEEESLELLYKRLSCDVPTGGFVAAIESVFLEDTDSDYVKYKDKAINGTGFYILESDADVQENLPLIPADICTCDRCKNELLDPNNRRYLHPFISCTICGPRYSILKSLPYDRDTITMGDFEMCRDCQSEYTSKLNIRRHAQTIACNNCGPKLAFSVIMDGEVVDYGNFAGNLAEISNDGKLMEKFLDNLENNSPEVFGAVKLLKNGGILAVKDIGGYHLACDPFNFEAVETLRQLKHREAKAFAVMFNDMESIEDFCIVNTKEKELLESPARPIVLLKRKNNISHGLAENVCLTSPDIGAMLPGNPVQILLAKAMGPLIMTSGNGSGDVLETDDIKMQNWLLERIKDAELAGIKIGILSHNRRILRPMDDSVMKVVCGDRQQFVRRGRGHVPTPVPVDIKGEIFGAGGDLKSSFCYVKNNLAYVSQYLGDMESVSCQNFYRDEKAAMKNIFGFKPARVVVDKHPGYFSSQINQGNDFQTLYKIQHHKAHVASVIAEYNIKGNVIGFAFDGTGYGDDGTIWGSEVFTWDEKTMERVAHLKPSRLIGGDEGAKNCDTILTGMLHGYGITPKEISMEKQLIMAALDKNINVIKSTSMGRLFDAVSALLDICHYNSYEGQAPIELENIAAKTDIAYPLHIDVDGDTKGLFEEIINALELNIPKEELARGFIYAVADYILEVSKEINSLSKGKDYRQVVLSGGTFLNRILLERATGILSSEGFTVYTSQLLPPGDGGLCLGQIYLACKMANLKH